MRNKNNVRYEYELYEPMRLWLHSYMRTKYRNYEITALDAHSQRLDKVLGIHGIVNDMAEGIDIQIDVLGIARKNSDIKLCFIEAKKTSLTLRDLGQLWCYCKLTNPDEAFLMTSADLGSLNKLLNIFKREDLLDFGDGTVIKKIKVAIWNLESSAPESLTMIPKM